MPKRRWLPANVTEYQDRHGKPRYRFRKAGLPDYHFKHAPGSNEFLIELEEARSASGIAGRHAPYSMDDLAHRLFKSPKWVSQLASTQYTYRRIIERYCDTLDKKGRRLGGYPARSATVAGIEKHLAAMVDTPAAANNLRKSLKKMFNYAIKIGWMKANPAALADGFKTGKGWHTWTDEEIDRYRAYWPYGTMARLTFELAMNTAARRCNIATLGRDDLVDGRWEIAHVKGNDSTSVRISAEARKAIDSLPAAPIRFFIVSAAGKPYTIESLGNRFRKWAKEAECPTTLHGIRKGVSRRLAEAGSTSLQGRAVTGHKKDETFAHYAAKANRRTLADAATALLDGEPNVANPEET